MFVCNMGWEDVGAAGEKSEVSGDQSTRELGNCVSYGGVGTFGDVLFLKHVIPTTSPCMAREIDVPVVTANVGKGSSGRRTNHVPSLTPFRKR